MNPSREPIEDPESLLTHADFVRGVVRGLLGRDGQGIDDVVQDTWVKALERPPGRPGALRGWLARVAGNLARQRRRADARRERRHTEVARSDAVPSTAEVVARENLRRRVVDHVLALDEPFRSVLLLRYFEDLRLDEIAARLDVPIGTVSSRLVRGLERLRRALDRTEGGRREWVEAVAPLAGLKAAGVEAALLAATGVTASKAALVLITLCVVLPIAGLWVAMDSERAAGTGTPPDALRTALVAHGDESGAAGPPTTTPSTPDTSDDRRPIPGSTEGHASRSRGDSDRPIPARDPSSRSKERHTRRSAGGELAAGTMPLGSLTNDMLLVPGGRVKLGLTPEQLIAVEQAAYPDGGSPLFGDLSRLVPELGATEHDVAPFYMARFPVTNAQYRIFVEQTGHRFPFHWWKDGRPDDFAARLPRIGQQVPNEFPSKPLRWWQQHWNELPSAIPSHSRDGAAVSADDDPVVFVSWADAAAFAAWAGMRLPSEDEWVRAARGDDDRQYLWGDDPSGPPGIDRGPRFDHVLPVGTFGKATAGRYGHGDMVLGVWE